MQNKAPQKYRARLMLRQPICDKKNNLMDYQWDSCEVEFTSKLSCPTVIGAETLSPITEKEQSISTPAHEILGKSVNELEISVRAANCLNVAGIKTIGDLATVLPAEMRKRKGVGNTMIDEYKKALKKFGVTWSEGS